MLQLKSAQKPFPVNVDVGVLKWRIQLPDEEALPLSSDLCIIMNLVNF
jgi:hypothetical protein